MASICCCVGRWCPNYLILWQRAKALLRQSPVAFREYLTPRDREQGEGLVGRVSCWYGVSGEPSLSRRALRAAEVCPVAGEEWIVRMAANIRLGSPNPFIPPLQCGGISHAWSWDSKIFRRLIRQFNQADVLTTWEIMSSLDNVDLVHAEPVALFKETILPKPVQQPPFAFEILVIGILLDRNDVRSERCLSQLLTLQ